MSVFFDADSESTFSFCCGPYFLSYKNNVYITAYLIHYFYNLKTKGDRTKRLPSDSDSASKNTLIKGRKNSFYDVINLKFYQKINLTYNK